MAKKEFRFLPMRCAVCSVELDKIEVELPGILHLKPDYERGRMEVEWDEEAVTEEDIRKAAADEGYALLK